MSNELTHFDTKGNAQMVDVTDKDTTQRTATAQARVRMQPATLEMILGGLVGEYLLARYASLSYGFLVQGLLNLVSYFIGGIAIGMLSPGLRIHEPAVGAFLCVALMLSLSFLGDL